MELTQYTYAAIIFAGIFVAFKVLQAFVLTKISSLTKKTKTDLDDAIVNTIRSVGTPTYLVIAIYFAVDFLSIGGIVDTLNYSIVLFAIVFQTVKVFHKIFDYVVKKKVKDKDPGVRVALETVSKIAKVVLWVIGGLLVLQNLGINVSSLVAGLGIGGIAIALAAQNILSDLFSSFSIIFDKPFVVGDFIVVGDTTGVVKKIGIKTTRLTSLLGEEIVISNKELTESRVQNFKKLKKRRVSFSVGVVYSTPSNQLEKIPDLIKESINSEKLTKFDRVNFSEFADSSLVFEVVYYFLDADYAKYKSTHAKILLSIKERFDKEGIDMAFPTRTVYLQK